MNQFAYNQKVYFGSMSSQPFKTICVANEEIYEFGGWNNQSSTISNDLYCYSLTTRKKTKCKVKGKKPQPRTQVTLTFNPNDEQLLIYGGMANQFSIKGDLHIIQIKTMECQEINYLQHENAPIERYGHIAQFSFPYLFIFSGKSIMGDLGDLWAFDVRKSLWKEIVPPNYEDISYRCHASATITRNVLYIFGGSKQIDNSDGSISFKILNDLLILDLNPFFHNDRCDDLSWKVIQFYECDKRFGSLLVNFNEKLFIFGGIQNKDSSNYDLISIDINQKQICYYDYTHEKKNSSKSQGGLISNCLVSLDWSRMFGSKIISGTYFYINLAEIKSKIINRMSFKKEIEYQSKEKVFLDIKSKLHIHKSKWAQEIKQYLSKNPSIISLFSLEHCIKLSPSSFLDYINYIESHIDMSDTIIKHCQINMWASTKALVIQSKYFESYFQFKKQQISQDSSPFVITISKDIQIQVVKIMIAYINTNVLILPQDITHQKLINIMHFCEYYQLHLAFSICEKQLFKSIDSSQYFDAIQRSQERQIYSIEKGLWLRILCQINGYSELRSIVIDNQSNPIFLETYKENKFDIIHRNFGNIEALETIL